MRGGARKGAGQPPKPPEKRRDSFITIAVTQSEKEQIIAAAKLACTSTSKYITMALFAEKGEENE